MQSFCAPRREEGCSREALEGAEEQIQGLSAKVLDQPPARQIRQEKEETEAERDGLRAEVEAFTRNEERTRQELRQASDESTAGTTGYELRTAWRSSVLGTRPRRWNAPSCRRRKSDLRSSLGSQGERG